MKINENSWHYRYYVLTKKYGITSKGFYDKTEIITLCSYVRTIIFSSIHFLYLPIIGIFLYINLLSLITQPGTYFLIVGLIIIAVILASICFWLMDLITDKMFKKPNDDKSFFSLLKEYTKATKNKICPIIETYKKD